MDKRSWLMIAAALSFFMAAVQTTLSLSVPAAAYFQAPPPLLENPLRLFLVGEAAALVLVVFALYALSGAGTIRRLPLLRVALIGISTLYLLRGLFLILNVMIAFGLLEGTVLLQGVISDLVFLTAGIAYAVGTAFNWSELAVAPVSA